MRDLIERIIKHNSPEEAAEKISKLLAKNNNENNFTIDDIRKAFQGGRDSVEAQIGYEDFGDMLPSAKKKIVKTFKRWIHENYNK